MDPALDASGNTCAYKYIRKCTDTMLKTGWAFVLLRLVPICLALEIPKGKYLLGIFTTYKPTICGIAEYSENMIRGFEKADRDIEIEVFNMVKLPQIKIPRSKKHKVINVPCTLHEELAAFKRAAEYIKARKFDGIIINHEYALVGDFRHFENLLRSLKPTGAAIYVIVHTPLAYIAEDRKKHMVRMAKGADAVIVMSWQAKHFLHHSYGIPESKVKYFPHGVRALHSSIDVRKLHKIPKDRYIIHSDGIMHSHKGIGLVLDAMKELKRRGALGNILLLITGLDNARGSFRSQILRAVSNYGLKDHVMWVYKFMSKEEMTALHKISDAYITLFDEVVPTSGTLTYAMYSGDAIISTPFRYALELLGGNNHPDPKVQESNRNKLLAGAPFIGHAGMFVPFKNPEALADTIELLRKSPELAESLRRNSRERSKNFSWETVSGHLAHFLKTKKNVYITPNPYTTKFFPSSCVWSSRRITDFTGEQLQNKPLDNGKYLIYKDPFVAVVGSVRSKKIIELLVKGVKHTRSKAREVYRMKNKKAVIVSGKYVKVTPYTENKCMVSTPNIVFFVVHNKKSDTVSFRVVFDNAFGHAEGALGVSLRQKYDLSRPGAPGFSSYRISSSTE